MYKPFHVFDELAKKFDRFVLAYSGGKGSTAVAILLYQWARIRKPNVEVVVLYVDTLSEINVMEAWARWFLAEYVNRLGRYVRARVQEAVPPAVNTFYWRVFVRGYPAPSLTFPWCVENLIARPAKKALEEHGNAVIITGLRHGGTTTKGTGLGSLLKSCLPGCCLGVYPLKSKMAKAAPIENWTEEDVWAFLHMQRDFDVSPLFALHRVENFRGSVRYGCWHCTVEDTQPALYLDDKLLYIEAFRVLYMAISRTPKYRVRRSRGRGKLGPLTANARSLMYHLTPIVERLSGHRFYGLDAAEVDGVSLRRLFYEYGDSELDEVVNRIDNTRRWVGAARLRRTPKIGAEIIDKVSKLDSKGLVVEKARELLRLVKT
ncbi:MAG: phosphoadenosine phosphosulfate reductase family protein [Pyrobaculum sp.]